VARWQDGSVGGSSKLRRAKASYAVTATRTRAGEPRASC